MRESRMTQQELAAMTEQEFRTWLAAQGYNTFTKAIVQSRVMETAQQQGVLQ